MDGAAEATTTTTTMPELNVECPPPKQPRPLAPPILVRDDVDADAHDDEDDPTTLARRRETWASSSSSFADLLLPPSLVSALAACGFARPSPVQEAAIPLGRARCDLIVQAKSGTGKTAVFAVVALERAMIHAAAGSASASSAAPATPELAALILSPTREVALQTAAVLARVASHLPAPQPQVAAFVGGTPPEDDIRRLRRPMHIAAGTPGRVGALLASGALLPGGGAVGLLVLDEADQLLGQDGLREDVRRVLRRVLPSASGAGQTATPAGAGAAAAAAGRRPRRPQVLALSATYTPELLRQLAGGGADDGGDDAPAAADNTSKTTTATKAAAPQPPPLMHRPRRVLLCSDGVAPMGILQRYVDVGADQEEEDAAAVPDEATDGWRRRAEAASASASPASLPTATAAKLRALLRVLGRLPFQQAVVFANNKASAPAVAACLARAGFPCVHVSGALPQRERAAALEAVRLLRTRVVVATDVLARGVDLARVTLVASLDLPPDAATYAHRCGRTGRFGRRGLAVAFVSGPEEVLALRAFAVSAGVAPPAPLRLSAALDDGDGQDEGAEEQTADERAAEAAAADAAAAAAAVGGGAAAQAAAEAAALQHGRGASGPLAARRGRRPGGGGGGGRGGGKEDDDGGRGGSDDDDDDGGGRGERGAWAKLLDARRRAVERPDAGMDALRDASEDPEGGRTDDEDDGDDPFGLGSGSSEGGGGGGGGGGWRAAALIAGLRVAPAAAAYHRRQARGEEEEQEAEEEEEDWEVRDEAEEQEERQPRARFVPPADAAADSRRAGTAATPPDPACRPSPECARCWAAAYTRWLHEHAAWQHDFTQWSDWQRDYAAWWQGQQQGQQVL